MQVVDAREHRPQHLAAAVQVVQVSPAHTSAAGVAAAGLVDRPGIGLVASVADAQVTEAGEQMAVAGVARGHHAVEHVDAAGHALDQVFGRAHAHQVARFVCRQPVRGVRHDAQHLVLGLAHADAANRVARQVERGQRFDRLLAQVLKHAALDDAEQRVAVFQPVELGDTAPGPAQAQLHRRPGLRLGGQHPFALVRRALVELHHDVAVEQGLHLHADLGRQEQLVAVDRRREAHTLLADLAPTAIAAAQAPDLKTAAVGQDRLLPAFEAVQSLELRDHVQTWAQPEVEGVAQDDLRAHLVQRRRQHALDRAVSAHRHEDRCLDHTVVQGQPATAGLAFGGEEVELQHGRDCRSAPALAIRLSSKCGFATLLDPHGGAAGFGRPWGAQQLPARLKPAAAGPRPAPAPRADPTAPACRRPRAPSGRRRPPPAR